MSSPPKVFISYSHDSDAHKEWVRQIASQLRRDGIDVTLDRWPAVPGDSLTAFMETAVRESDYILIICTPKYKERSDNRIGPAGYEGDIISAEILAKRNQRKFIPILRTGPWDEASPTSLLSKIYIDFRRPSDFDRGYNELITTLHGARPSAPPLGPRPSLLSLVNISLFLPDVLPSDFGLARGILIAGVLIFIGSIIYLGTSKTPTVANEKPAKLDLVMSVLTPRQEHNLKPFDAFAECAFCPQMVVVGPGRILIGSPTTEPGRLGNEGPQERVTISKLFAVGKFPVTFDQWDACANDGGCRGYHPSDQGWGRKDRPVINISWLDAKSYVDWLSRKTGKTYRLPADSEREYFTRAGTSTPFWWGTTISPEQANYNGNFSYNGGPKGQFRGRTVPVKTFQSNPWGLYQVHGNVAEWVEDCFRHNTLDVPTDGSAYKAIECSYHVLRGGSWRGAPSYARSASRFGGLSNSRGFASGFRVVREISQTF